MRETVSARSRPAWLPTAGAIALLMVATLWLYRETVQSLVTTWGNSETFAHGYWVPLIAMWLLWRKRAELAALAPSYKPAPSALLAVAAAAVLWLVGDLAEVNPARQFALVGMIVLTVPVVAGWRTASALMFPLGFLFFAVPFGEFLLPWLMARTADFTVLALRASGVPVYTDGLQLVIPTGQWSVVEACSGIRYLIASLMVGSLFAYLHYRSMRRRLLFMLVALAVPIVANWVRAYMIVMIGHLSNNTLAVGVDHILYGWVFFGIVIGVMFTIGMRWSEQPSDAGALGEVPIPTPQPGAPHRLWAMGASMAMLVALPMLVLSALTMAQDQGEPNLSAPALAGTVVVAEGSLPAWTPAFRNPSTTLERQYDVQGRAVGVYIGYYRAQGRERRLVSSSNALVDSSDRAWIQVASGAQRIDLGERDLVVKTARLRRPLWGSDSTKLIAWQVYWVNGTLEASDVWAKAWGAWHRLLGRGDDGAVIIVYALEERPGDADALLGAFLRQHLAAIDAQLRKTRDGD